MIYEIEKSYSRNLPLGNYKTLRVGLTAKFKGEIKTKDQLKKVSNRLLTMLRETVDDELQILKEEEEERNE